MRTKLKQMTIKTMDFIKYKGIVWKMPLAAALSWELAKWAGSKHPYLAPLTVILSIQLTVDKSIQFAWQRILGTIAGVLFTSAIAPYVGLSGWSLGLLLLAGALAVTWLKLDHAIMVQVALSILLVLFFHSKMPSYSADRIRDTVIGAIVAIVIHILIFPPDSVRKAKKKMVHFADHLSQQFIHTANWVQAGCTVREASTLQTQLRALFQELHQATTELEKAGQSLRYHPLGRKKQLELNQLNRQMQQLRSGYANLSDIVQVLVKWSGSGDFTQEDQQAWTGHLHSLAELVQNWKKALAAPAATAAFLSLQGAAPGIKAPAHTGSDRYRLALYMNAEQVVQDFGKALPNKAP